MKKWNNEKFIKKAKEVHGNKYDYSKVEYINSRTNINIVCKIHGNFKQLPSNHIRGYGCHICGIDRRKIGLEKFIKKAKEVHGNKYDYSKVEYINNHTNVCIVCSKHDCFVQLPINHLKGHGCPICMVDNHIKKHSFNKNIFIEKAKEVHGNKYDYSKVEYINNHTNVCIVCSKHGDFYQSYVSHINHKCGCPFCKSSKSESFIKNWLENNNIKFISEKRFMECKNNRSLPFDFYLPEYNTCIEYDGEQHFYPIDFSFGKLSHENVLEKFIDVKKNDSIKTNFCKKEGINLLRISYKQNIKKELEKWYKEKISN